MTVLRLSTSFSICMNSTIMFSILLLRCPTVYLMHFPQHVPWWVFPAMSIYCTCIFIWLAYKANFAKLQQMVLIGGPDDGVITPWQSRSLSLHLHAVHTNTEPCNRLITITPCLMYHFYEHLATLPSTMRVYWFSQCSHNRRVWQVYDSI